MNQVKIGKFISEKRKERGMTQFELAEKLNITDRSISKWETGACLPDAYNMLELCKILGVSINDLFSGEVVDQKNSEKKLESNLLTMIKIKDQTDKKLFMAGAVIGILATIILLSFSAVAYYVEMAEWMRNALVVMGFVICMMGILFVLRIEQTVGYYECQKCRDKFMPNYMQVLLAMHLSYTRYMKCSKCNKRSWCRKIVK